MDQYRLSKQARQHIRDIGHFTKRAFGLYQAKAYHSGLERTFGLLAQFPDMGVSADELVAGLRRFQFQSHYIFYIEADDTIIIRALLHVGTDIRPALFR